MWLYEHPQEKADFPPTNELEWVITDQSQGHWNINPFKSKSRVHMSTQEAKVCPWAFKSKTECPAFKNLTPGWARGRGGGGETAEKTGDAMCCWAAWMCWQKWPHARVVEAGGAMRWGYAGGTCFCVETQQCARNVILNPELHVLRIVFFFFKLSLNQ